MTTKADVNTPAAEYTAMQADWARIEALLGGTKAMRAAGETYLPKFGNEAKEEYEARLKASVLFGGFAQTLDTMVGLPFAKPVVLGDDVPPRIKALAEDIDQAGNHLDVFARGVFRRGLAKGPDHILVDMTAEKPQSAADDLTRRPRWIPVAAEQLIDGRKARIGGKDHYVHVRIRETVTEWEGYEQRVVNQVREIEPPVWRVWRMNDKREWFVFEEGAYDLPYVTLASFFAGEKRGEFTARPPMDNLAHLNIAHWQSASDQRNVLTFSRFGILFVRGMESGGAIALGPHTILNGTSDKADAKIVEHSGAAIQAGERDLEALKRDMEAEGVRMLTRRPGNVTATENAIEEAKDQSELETMARGLGDTLELALGYTADWLGEAGGGSVEVNRDFGIVANAAGIKDTVLALRKNGDLSAEDAMTELQRAGLLSDELDVEAAVERAGVDAARTLGLMERQTEPAE